MNVLYVAAEKQSEDKVISLFSGRKDINILLVSSREKALKTISEKNIKVVLVDCCYAVDCLGGKRHKGREFARELKNKNLSVALIYDSFVECSVPDIVCFSKASMDEKDLKLWVLGHFLLPYFK